MYIVPHFECRRTLLQKYWTYQSLMEKKSNPCGGEDVPCNTEQQQQGNFGATSSHVHIFSSNGGAEEKGRNAAEVEGAVKQHAEAGKQKEEMDHQVGYGQFVRIGKNF